MLDLRQLCVHLLYNDKCWICVNSVYIYFASPLSQFVTRPTVPHQLRAARPLRPAPEPGTPRQIRPAPPCAASRPPGPRPRRARPPGEPLPPAPPAPPGSLARRAAPPSPPGPPARRAALPGRSPRLTRPVSRGPAPAGPARPPLPPSGPACSASPGRRRSCTAPPPSPPPPQGPPALIHISRDQPRAHELTKYIGQPSPAPGRVSARASWSLNRWAPDRSAVRYLWGMVPVSPARTTGTFPKMEDNGTTYMTSLPGIGS